MRHCVAYIQCWIEGDRQGWLSMDYVFLREIPKDPLCVTLTFTHENILYCVFLRGGGIYNSPQIWLGLFTVFITPPVSVCEYKTDWALVMELLQQAGVQGPDLSKRLNKNNLSPFFIIIKEHAVLKTSEITKVIMVYQYSQFLLIMKSLQILCWI